MNKVLLIVLFAVLSSISLKAQKVKYKDLYPLLDAKRYDDAEPFLRQFIKDEKNRDKYPNSLFQMGLIFSEKAFTSDILTETEQFQSYADSAILQYQNAIKQIDDKELRKNEEYYQAYKRRDIRSGEFGISLADIHFDIEKKIKALKTRKTQVNELVEYFNKSKSSYDTAIALYAVVKENYKTQKRLLLRLNAETTERIDFISSSYEESLENFKGYKNILEDVSRTNYEQELLIKEISEMENEGSANADWLDNNVEVWNYRGWVELVKNTHENDVIPLFNQLITFDKELSALQGKIRSDSISVTNEIPSLISIEELDELKSFDSNPMPVVLFNYRIERVNYDSYKMEQMNYLDSSNVDFKLSVAEDLKTDLNNLDSLIQNFSEIDLEEESKNYKPFLETQYKDGLAKYLKAETAFIEESIEKNRIILDSLVERSRWSIVESDSIPLFNPESISEVKHAPILIDSLVTAGLYFSGEEPAQGYIADINPQKQSEIYEYFEVDTELFNKANIENIMSEALVLLGDTKTIYFTLLYIPVEEGDGFNGVVIRANEEGLMWSNSIMLTSEPGKLAYNISTDEIIINYKMADLEGVGGELVGNKITLSPKGEIVE